MKLIDVLVKELPQRGGWPEYVAAMAQDADGAVQNYRGTDDIRIDSQHASGTSRIIGSYSIAEDEVRAATDRLTAIITRAQYESALAASEGWIEWNGGECPVNDDCIVDVKFMCGQVENAMPARYWEWGNQDHRRDIISYRLHKPGINSRANDDRLEQDLNECIGQDVDMPEWSGDGLPPAGCECEAKYRDADNAEWFSFRCVGVDCGVAFGWAGKEAVILGKGSYEFLPLRTEAEKVREKLAASLHVAAGAIPIEVKGIGPLYFELADAIISGSIFGTTFKAEK